MSEERQQADNSKSKTLADIVAAKRRLAAEMAKSLGDQHSSVESLIWEADRIEAAAKRERDAAPGNIAAMREALVRVRDWLKRMNAGALQALAVSQITPAGAVNRSASGLIEDNDFYISVCDAALAAAPRNCDVGTPAEQADRFHRDCRAHRTFFTECSASCPFTSAPDINHCQSGWAQLPYEAAKEGGAL